MTGNRNIWLIANAGSGSVREDVLASIDSACEEFGVCIARRSTFPDDGIPTRQTLAEQGIETVVTLGGDGTINAVVSGLAGWDGAILPLPGGTQNLTPKRLHGDADVDAVFAAFASGKARRVRPGVLRSSKGIALAGLLVGPGTSWNAVREAMREGDAGTMLSAIGTAIEGTTGNPPVRIAQPEVGEQAGYPIVELIVEDGGIDIAAYHARNGADFLGQTWALLRQEFREGPHETYGPFDRIVIASTGDDPLDLLLDGEPAPGDAQETFTLEPCQVDLIATATEVA
ncbi:MAG: acylglycerol kinase family protein [Erythrobacter sp.]|nr:acylglycerol kinase family protein [Erythrobacter sp.]NCQ62804.1 acylglycerol kinase family protein [Alphaproteobacteria bacterium]